MAGFMMRYVKCIVAFCVFFFFIPVATAKNQPQSDVVKKDGTYLLYANGIVKDTKTGLEWMAGPNKDMTWDKAKSWVDRLKKRGVGWRMPTMNELDGIYEKGVGDRNMSRLLKTTGWWVWAEETEFSSDAEVFSFSYGSRAWTNRDTSCYGRAFAVRSRSDG